MKCFSCHARKSLEHVQYVSSLTTPTVDAVVMDAVVTDAFVMDAERRVEVGRGTRTWAELSSTLRRTQQGRFHMRPEVPLPNTGLGSRSQLQSDVILCQLLMMPGQ